MALQAAKDSARQAALELKHAETMQETLRAVEKQAKASKEAVAVMAMRDATNRNMRPELFKIIQ